MNKVQMEVPNLYRIKDLDLDIDHKWEDCLPYVFLRSLLC